MKKFSSAFTMIELVFVIVVLGILAGVAVPRLAATRDDANIAKVRGDIAAIRSGISLARSERLMRGDVTWPSLEKNPDVTATLFENVLQQPIYPKTTSGGWTQVSANSRYQVTVAKKTVTFTYDGNGTFDCSHTDAMCQKLAQ